MLDNASFDDLMARLRQGDNTAEAEVFHRFRRRLIGLAQSRLGGLLRAKVDPEDVMQSVFKSFFLRHAEGQFELEDWDSLWSLLTTMTLRKCGYQIRHFRRGGRDVQREVKPQPGPDDSSASWEAIAREPTPAEAMLLAEAVEQLFRGLDDRERDIVQLSLQGYDVAEISPRVGRAERSVYRVLERVKGRLLRLSAEDFA
jgi:RNA polymerase sigma-70 factor (ECF subfamily)